LSGLDDGEALLQDARARGQVLIASRSRRPADVSLVTRVVIVPSLLELLFQEAGDMEAQA